MKKPNKVIFIQSLRENQEVLSFLDEPLSDVKI